jgi:hypothetical protein
MEHLIISVLTLGHPIDTQHLESQRAVRRALAALQRRGWSIQRVYDVDRERELHALSEVPLARDPRSGDVLSVTLQIRPAADLFTAGRRGRG